MSFVVEASMVTLHERPHFSVHEASVVYLHERLNGPVVDSTHNHDRIQTVKKHVFLKFSQLGYSYQVTRFVSSYTNLQILVQELTSNEENER